MAASLSVGIRSLPSSVSGAILFLVDMPGLIADVSLRLIDAHWSSGDKICVPVFAGK